MYISNFSFNCFWPLGIRLLFLLIISTVILNGMASAKAPRAGSTVVNQATIQYFDSDGIQREATSNEVTLFVQQVFSGTVLGDNQRLVAPGKRVLFSHTIENTGNGTDEFCVRAVQISSDSGSYTDIDIYRDLDFDGQISGADPLIWSLSDGTTFGRIILSADELTDIVIRAQIPAGANSPQTYGLDFIASSTEGTGICETGSVTDIGANIDNINGTNRDVATVTIGAVLEVTKSSTYIAGIANTLADDQIDYTIRIRNTGLFNAANLDINDFLPAEISFDSFGLHDGVFSAGPSHLGGEISAGIAILAPEQEAVIRVLTNVEPTLGQNGGTLMIENTVAVTADLNGDGNVEPAVLSNTVLDYAAVSYGVSLDDIGGVATANINDGADDDGLHNDTQTVDMAAPGQTIYFALDVTNTGNDEDSFDLTFTSMNGWFSGAAVHFLETDFATRLSDTNANSLPDTGPLKPSEEKRIIVAVIVPHIVPSGPHNMIVTASGAGGVSDPATLVITNASSAKVDIANLAGVPGFNDAGALNAHDASAVTTTLSSLPGVAIVFDLFIANEGEAPDNFTLNAKADLVGTAELPAGWSVSFVDSSGQIITETGLMKSDAVMTIQAIVLPPQGAIATTTQSIFFHIISALTGAADVKQDAVTIISTTSLYVGPDKFSQISPCGILDNLHVIRNEGDTAENVIVSIASQTSLAGEIRFATALSAGRPEAFQPANLMNVGDLIAVYNGTAWIMTALVSDGGGGVAIPLASGEQTQFSLRLTASCNLTNGAVDNTQILVMSTDGDVSGFVNDTTTVALARVDLAKHGALDTTCDMIADGAFDDTQIRASPGECVLWKISLKNTSTETVCDVFIRDAAPEFTSFLPLPPILTQPVSGTGVCTLSGSNLDCSVGYPADTNSDGLDENYCLGSGEDASVTFAVKIE